MTTRVTIPIALLAISLSGCAFQETLKSGTDNPCATLKEIVEDYPAEFASFRRGGTDYRSVTIYRAKQELIRGHCEVWAWGNADSAYVCTVGAPDPEVASALYRRAVEQVSGCLGPEWALKEEERERDGQADGLATRFRHPDSTKPAVSVHNVEDRSRRSVYLYIGSPARAF
ncbi:hypothetical protein [Marinobacter sp. ATCH36]|uniref:hypothetical protein n=1 Tax=Marinobacter sp. ATCH36 TaxID=2945106 RepID=UPI0020219974|nr:hypothetical protein [Marinobacter sp. ATCH36]MCL7942392.1 hypothetical protein [Marinobacter sp. ATCH36]